MSVGTGMIGREVTATIGGLTILGVISKALTFNNEPLDTTDDQASGNQEFLAKSGLKSVEFTISGTMKNLELVQAYTGSSQIFEIVIDYPDGTTGSNLTFDAFMASLSQTGESNGLVTFDATFNSSGALAFTPAT